VWKKVADQHLVVTAPVALRMLSATRGIPLDY
jgi:hypothetical protein